MFGGYPHGGLRAEGLGVVCRYHGESWLCSRADSEVGVSEMKRGASKYGCMILFMGADLREGHSEVGV